jgi:hypothetical protein
VPIAALAGIDLERARIARRVKHQGFFFKIEME